jgi:hypothetical protein
MIKYDENYKKTWGKIIIIYTGINTIFHSNDQVDLVDMQSMPDGNYKYKKWITRIIWLSSVLLKV